MTDTLDWSTLLRMLTHLKSNFNINMENKKILHCRNINKIHRTILERGKILPQKYIRDRPFNLKGGGGYGFLFRSVIFFRTTRELEYLFFFVAKREFFFPEFNIRLYDKHSESNFFFPPPKSEYFFQQHWESEYFF